MKGENNTADSVLDERTQRIIDAYLHVDHWKLVPDTEDAPVYERRVQKIVTRPLTEILEGPHFLGFRDALNEKTETGKYTGVELQYRIGMHVAKTNRPAIDKILNGTNGSAVGK